MKAILGSVERDVADAFAYIPYGLAAAVVFLLIMICTTERSMAESLLL